MVDPNRKINRLTEEDISFLDECEELFANRFTEDDEQFMAHSAKPLCEPPVVMNFSNGGGGGPGGGHYGQSNSYRGRYNDNRPNYRGGHGGGPHRNRSYQRRPFARNISGDGGGFRQNNRNNRHPSNRNEENRSTAMNFRRDYGNFVPASSNDRGS